MTEKDEIEVRVKLNGREIDFLRVFARNSGYGSSAAAVTRYAVTALAVLLQEHIDRERTKATRVRSPAGPPDASSAVSRLVEPSSPEMIHP